MKHRISIVLGCAALALGAYIFFYEQHTLSTAETAGRRGRALTQFVRNRVERVTLRCGDQPTITFERTRDEADELGTWQIVEPQPLDADEEAVDGLLSDMEWLNPQRTYEHITPENRVAFGLDEPDFELAFRVADQNVQLQIGGEDPQGAGRFAAIEGAPGAIVIPNDFVEAIDHDLSHFRNKELTRAYPTTSVSRLSLSAGPETFAFDRNETRRWFLDTPFSALARTATVNSLLSAVRELRAERYISTPPESGYGFEPPYRRVTLTFAEATAQTDELAIVVGGACAENGRFVRVGADEDVACVAEAGLEAFGIDLTAAWENRVLWVPDENIERIDFLGERPYTLRRAEQGWTFGDERTPADPAAIAEWTARLRAALATGHRPAEDAAHNAWQRRFRIQHADSEEPLEVSSMPSEGGTLWLRRTPSPAQGEYAYALAQALSPMALEFRSREIVTMAPESVLEITLERARNEETIVRDADNTWGITTTAAYAHPDNVLVQGVLEAFHPLRASRFVAEVANPEHGLSNPTLRVRIETQSGESERVSHVLNVGAPAGEDGFYAQWNANGPVFILTQTTFRSLDVSWPPRDAVAVHADALERLRVQHGETTLDLTRDDNTWRVSGGTEVPAAPFRQWLDRLETLRATRFVAYGNVPETARSLGEVQFGSTESPQSLRFWSPPGGPGEQVWVSRSDLEGYFAVPHAQADRILSYRP